MGFKFIYRNDKKVIDDNLQCELCKKELNDNQNCIGNEKVAVCFRCAHEIERAIPKITEEN